jgi:hypothetical protein
MKFMGPNPWYLHRLIYSEYMEGIRKKTKNESRKGKINR